MQDDIGRLRTLNKELVNNLLRENFKLRYYTLEGKAFMMADSEKIGALQYNTYLKLLPKLKLIRSNAFFEEYELKED